MKISRILSVLALSLLVAALATGCGGNPKTFQVGGTVTYRGKPVEGASVVFFPTGARPAAGKTDAQGRFTLLSYKPGDGAVLGEHVVCITKTIPDPKADPKLLKSIFVLPECYNTPLKSPLRAKIAADGPNEFKFELTD